MTMRGPLADEAVRLGPAITSFPVVGAALVDDGTYAVVSRNLRPVRVALLDLRSGSARAVVEIPTGDGAWGIASDGGGGAWLGMFGARGRANLYRLAAAGGAWVVEVAAAIDATHLWDLAVADDGVVYGVSDGPAGLFAFDPTTWLARDLEVVDSGAELARSVAVVGRTAVVGGRRDGRALLRAVPLDGGAVRDVLPPALAEHELVYALDARGGRLAMGTRGPGRRSSAIAVLGAAALSAATDGGVPDAVPVAMATVAGADVVDGLLLDGEVCWATVRPTGAVLRLDLRDGGGTPSPVEVARPVPGAEQRGLARFGGSLVGATGDGSRWALDLGTGDVVVSDLVADAVVVGGAEIVQSLAAADGTVWAGGTFGVAGRRGDGPLRRVAVPGEPKALSVVDGDLLLALYPIAEVWVLPVGDRPRRLTALPPEENRPLALHHHARRDVLLVGTAADAGGGGGFHVVARSGGALLASRRDPLGAEQAVSRVAAREDTALLGGRDGTILAVALATLLDGGGDGAAGDAALWRVDRPVPGGGAVSGLAVLGDAIHVLTAGGWHLVVDAATGAERQRRRIGATGGGVVVAGGRVLAVDADRLLALAPAGPVVLLEGLAPRHWAQPTLAADGDDVYVLHGTDEVRVTLSDTLPS